MTQNHFQDFTVEEMTELDPALVVSVINASMPEDAWETEDEVRVGEELWRPGQVPLRLVVRRQDRPVAFGLTGTNIFDPKGKHFIGIFVLPEFRQRGIATHLYDRLESYARDRGADSVRAGVHEHFLPMVQPWLEKKGFTEIERMRPSELRLPEMDFERWAPAEDRVTDAGITLTTLADDDTEARRRKLWELSELTKRDIPHHGPPEEFPFEQFSGLLDRPEARRNCLVIAEDSDRFVGYTMLIHQTPDRALTGLTGVDPAYRNRGIALAVKVRCARLARDSGYTAMRTYNHVNNPAMLAVNDRLGYVALPHFVLFQRALESA